MPLVSAAVAGIAGKPPVERAGPKVPLSYADNTVAND